MSISLWSCCEESCFVGVMEWRLYLIDKQQKFALGVCFIPQ